MNKGFTLIEVILGLVVFGFFSFGGLNLYTWVSTEGDRTMSLTRRNIENEQMLEHLTQPIYFGMLANYQQNIALRECLTADGKLCDVKIDYPLTAMDIATGQPINYVSDSLAAGLKNTLSFKVHCPLNQSSCDQPEYFVVKVITEVKNNKAIPYAIESTAMVVPQITSISVFTPDSAMSPGRSINVVMLLDNSNSLIYTKEKIKAALSELTNSLGSLNTRVAIYSLFSGKNISYVSTYYTLSGTTKTNITSAQLNSMPGGSIFYKEMNAKYNYQSTWYPENTNFAIVDFNTTDSAATKSLKLSALNDRVEKIFLDGIGTTWDTPFCEMLHIIKSPDQIIPISNLIPTVFILLTNEDEGTRLISDFSGSTLYTSWNVPVDCFKTLTSENKTSPPVYSYWGKKIIYNFTVEANFIMDGAPSILSKSAKILVVNYDSNIVIGADCLANAANFDREIKDAMLTYFPYGEVVFTGEYAAKTCTTELATQGLNLVSEDPNLCSAKETDFVTTRSWYKPLSCTRADGGSSSNMTKWDSIVPLVEWSSPAYLTQDTPKAVYESLQAKNVLQNIFFIPIIHSENQSSSCPLTTGATYGKKYESLASLLGPQAEVISICNSDYSAKIKSLTEGFLKNIGLNDIEIPAEVAATLKYIEVTRGTSLLYPIKNQDYQLFNTTLIFTSGYLRADDILKVYTQ